MEPSPSQTHETSGASVMLVGVLPPPFHGQSLATKAIFDAPFPGIAVTRVGIHSSKAIAEIGKASLGKALGLVAIVFRIWRAWLTDRPAVLYYTAGSGSWVPFIRDLVVLTLCRPLFSRTIIHYHSGDLPDFLASRKFLPRLGSRVYGHGAWSVKLGAGCPVPDYPSNREWIIPNGIEPPEELPPRSESDRFRILFLGNLFAEKGVFDLIDALASLASESSRTFELRMVGSWPDDLSRQTGETKLRALPANVIWHPPAPAYGDDKWRILMDSDVLVFPTRYPRENSPLVILEAMAAGLPVVTTPWRGIPELVTDGETGLLVPCGDLPALAAAIGRLAEDDGLRTRMGRTAAADFGRKFTGKMFLQRMAALFLEANRRPRPSARPNG